MSYEPIVSGSVAVTVLAGIIYQATGNEWAAAAVPVAAFALWRLAHAVAAATLTEADDRFLAALEGDIEDEEFDE
jgi:hypothetical protein